MCKSGEERPRARTRDFRFRNREHRTEKAKMVSCHRAVTAESLEEHFDKNMYRMLEYFHVAGASVAVVAQKEIYHTPECVSTSSYDQEDSLPSVSSCGSYERKPNSPMGNTFFKFCKSFGFNDIEKDSLVDIENTLFDSGTCARVLCGLALSELEKEGKIDMQSNVSKYLDNYKGPMTVEDILKKRTKLAVAQNKENLETVHNEGNEEDDTDTWEDNASWCAEQIIEEASGVTFQTYMEETLLPKLGIRLPKVSENGKECFTYIYKNKKMMQLKTLQSKLTPDSGLITSTSQMSKILMAVLEEVQNNEDNLKSGGSLILPGFGFGFNSVRFFPGSMDFFVCVSAIQDNGNAIICVEPRSKWAIWIACNTCCEDKGNYQDLFKGEPLCYFILKEFISTFGLSDDYRRSMMKWTIDPGPGRGDHVATLFCFPYVGGNSRSIFSPWYQLLPEFIEVKSISLPGRGPRINEKPHTKLLLLAEQIAIGILPILKDKKFAFYGDGIGALVAFEVGRYLYVNHGLSPMWCFFSGCPSPTTYGPKYNAALLENRNETTGSRLNAAMIDRLCSSGKLPMVLKENPLLARAMLPSIQADLSMESMYKYKRQPYKHVKGDEYFCESDLTTLCTLTPNSSPRREATRSVLQLQCPITVFRESKLSEQEEKDLDQWKLVTEKDDVLFVQVPGSQCIDKDLKTMEDICTIISESIGTSLTKFESWIGWAARCM